MAKKFKRVLVTGGGGYVGSNLVPKLLKEGYQVTVLDLVVYGEQVFQEYCGGGLRREVKGDLRDPAVVRRSLKGCDAVIHLVCISKDPSFELDREFGSGKVPNPTTDIRYCNIKQMQAINLARWSAG